MQVGRRYRHKYCTEVDIYINEISCSFPEFITCVIYYISQKSNDIISDKYDIVTINRSDFENWKEMHD